MEQRKDLKIQPVQVASTDPAFISGLMSSGRDEPEEPAGDAPGQTEQDEAAEVASAEHALDTEADAEATDASEESSDAAEASAEAEADADADAEAEAAEAEASAAADSDKPVFEAADRRGSVTIDAEGARLTLDDQAADWTWGEIAAIEYETSRFGRRLTVTVHTPDRRWYPGEVQAPDKATLKEWTAQLDDVLDAYFEDEEEASDDDATSAEAELSDETAADADEPSAEAEAEAGSEADAEAAADAPQTKAKAESAAKD